MEDSMDIDIDLGDGQEYAHVGAELAPESTAALHQTSTQDQEIPEAYKDDFDASFPAKEKIYISGLDGVAQPVIIEYINIVLGGEKKFRRLEWIDDSSANIIFQQASEAADALVLFTGQDTLPPPQELRPARPFDARPDLQFSVRQSMVSDKKAAGAKDRSAFYLFNPEWDPENRKYDRRYDRRGRGGRRGRESRKPAEKLTFTEDMYDDAPVGQSAEEGEMFRRMSTTSVSSGEHARRKRKYEEGDDLFAKKRETGRLSNRSRSPFRDGDGRYGFSEQPQTKTARTRTRSPPAGRVKSNAGKELFGDQQSSKQNGADLFPTPVKRDRELFPNRTPNSNHRRTDALDREDTAEIFAKQSRSLADRITGGPVPQSNTFSMPQSNGFSIRGAGDAQPGFSIKGASFAKVKELFPDKTPGNSGKELFPSARRRRAEDLMD